MSMNKYSVVNNHRINQCHPETCCCDDWALIDECRKVIERSDDKKYLEGEAESLNKKENK